MLRSLYIVCLLACLPMIAMAVPKYQNDQFKSDKKVASIWPSIPFIQGGDIGQYQKTMSQDRDEVRKMFWKELMDEVQKLADKGMAVELMLEPMANILMMFDQIHDIHKAKDVVRIDVSLEAQFKSQLDNLFQQWDVRDAQRKVQFSSGTDRDLLEAYIRGISVNKPLGNRTSEVKLNVKKALEIYEQVDYTSYGTFSSLGKGMFQLTYHLTGFKNGVSRNFVARGTLTRALDDLVQQVFDFFQKNQYPQWETPHAQLVWMPTPVNFEKESGYTFAEARQYCQQRGYRLPYAKEILMAESGTQYQAGGINNLRKGLSYAVLDRRGVSNNHWLTPGHEDRTGGAVQADQGTKGSFWCVKGQANSEILFVEQLWSQIRKWRKMQDSQVYRALETIRYEIGDFGASESFFFGGSMLRKLDSVEEALDILNEAGIELRIPDSLRRPE